jgi:protein-S-isoprenylcysteine O-methyltransferase Ste14
MRDWKKTLYTMNPLILATVGGIFQVAQIVLSLFRQNPAGHYWLRVVGWTVWAFSAYFGIAPIIEFRRRGGVSKGRSYMRTTRLVETGPYALVRHPQYLAGILISVALPLITQDWIVTVLAPAPIAITCLDAIQADRNCIENFGDDYRAYMERVPRLNPLAGYLRRLLG